MNTFTFKRQIPFILILLLNCIFFLKIDAQSELFTSNNSKWHQFISWWTPVIGGGTVNHYGATTWMIKDDTLVNNQLIQKIYFTGNSDKIDTGCYRFECYVYNSGHKIFAGKYLDSMSLVYNFNLVVGDSFEFHGSTNYNFQPKAQSYFPKVDSVSSIYYAGKWRKYIRFELLPYGTRFSWLEGVGDPSYGLLPDIFTTMLINSFGTGTCKLTCFADGETNSEFGSCFYKDCTKVNVNDPKNELHEINIYPNPISSNIIYISTNIKIHECHFIDAFGNAYPIILNEGNNKYQIEILSFLSPGIYFLQIKNERGIVTKKVII